ncbi:MAG: molybdopterin cofactor-binding domain-containing protein [Pseudomonadota bacterium]
MSRIGTIARRTFLIGAAAVTGGVALGYYYYQRDPKNPIEAMLAEGESTFNPYLKIGSDNTITVYTGRAEMGQGVSTTLAAYVAEELDVEMDQITVEHGPGSSAYRNIEMLREGAMVRPWDDSFSANMQRSAMATVAEIIGAQATGGSSSTRDGYERMRAAGCAAREMLKAAAVARLGVDAAGLSTEAGHVIAGDQRIAYGDLAAEAAALPVPSKLTLRDPKDWRLLGRSLPRTDVRAKVTGTAVYGTDIDLPGMVYGTVRMSPRFGADVVSYDDTEALKVPGVEKIIRIDTHDSHGFGVIASNTWAAFQGAEAIEVEWEEATYPKTVEDIMDGYRTALNAEDGASFRAVGDAAAAIANAPGAEVIEAEYTAPFLAHACMEPMNATAQFAEGKLTIWCPNQSPTIIAMAGAAAVDVDRDDVTVHTTYLGGGFGRRAEPDFARYAAHIAKETDGRPVNVTWTREEDTRHDTYRPAAIGRFKAVVPQGGEPTAFHAKVATPSIMQSVMGRAVFAPPSPSPDRTAVEGIFDQPVDFEHVSVAAIHPDQNLPIGFWRSVGNSFNGFFHEGFMDEIAVASGQDPVEMRLKLMANYPTAQKTLAKVAEMSGWGRDPGANRGLGVAFTFSFGSWVAQVAEVTDTPDGIRIDNVWCAADVGRALDPAIVSAQMSSGIVFGLSSAINQQITLADGEVQEGNFWDFDAMRMAQCPTIEVAVLENADHMGGAGEPGMPPSVPALGNAIFAATGKRLRSLPFGNEVAFLS